jgi:hypothetical protein
LRFTALDVLEGWTVPKLKALAPEKPSGRDRLPLTPKAGRSPWLVTLQLTEKAAAGMTRFAEGVQLRLRRGPAIVATSPSENAIAYFSLLIPPANVVLYILTLTTTSSAVFTYTCSTLSNVLTELSNKVFDVPP